MRVLLCHKFFHLVGGAEVFFFQTGKALEENGHDVAWFSTVHEKNQASEYSSYFVEPPEYNEGNIIQKVGGIGKIIYSKEAREKFRKLVDDFKPDIVHVFAINVHISPSILDVCKEKNIPVVMSCNDYKHICPNYKLYHHGRICLECSHGNYLNAIKNMCCKESAVFTVASVMEAYAHRFMGVYKNKVDLYLFASEFMRDKTREFWGNIGIQYRDGMLRNPFHAPDYPCCEEDEDFALYFGRVEEDKGIFDILKAAAAKPDIRFRIIGNGGGMERAEAFIAENKLTNVEMLGEMWGEPRDEILKKCSFVLVSSRWHENFPYVINESFAYGKPVVGANRGGIPELVNHGERGLVYEVDAEGALEDAIEKLWHDRELRKSCGLAAKQWVDAEFNYEKFYQTVIGHYESLVH